MTPKLSRLFSTLSLLALASCGTTSSHRGSDYLAGLGYTPPQAPQVLGVAEHTSYWDDDGSSGSSYMVVDLRRQVAEFYRGGHVIGVAAISSGVENRRTPAGDYKILEKDIDHVSSLYGTVEDGSGKVVNIDATPRSSVPPGCRYVPAPMYFFMRLTYDGVGMHQGFLPGYPASHGCIRMDRNVVPKFFENAYVGMPVKVVR
ncbi:MAG: L,D-transpeptidase family protein [Roseimicrobium sp.]